MTWAQRYRLGHQARDSIWVLPVAGLVAGLLAARVLDAVGTPGEGGHAAAATDPDTARALLGALATSAFTFVVFVSSAMLLTVQLASAQLTPRILSLLFRDVATRGALTLFVFIYTLSLAALVRVGDGVPMLATRVAAYGSVVGVVVFLYLIDHVGKSFRPSGALRAVALRGHRVIAETFRARVGGRAEAAGAGGVERGKPTTVVPSDTAGVVLAFDPGRLVDLARREECVIELVPKVGAFVAADDPLFRVYGGGGTVAADELLGAVAFGHERTMDQDPAFAFRIIVDVACKALSPAINDPTTAVLAVDQLYQLLRNVGGRELGDGVGVDGAGEVRLVFHRPGWEDFVYLAVTEVRQYGGESIQVVRRLRAMLDGLIRSLPEDRTAVLRMERQLLQRGADRLFLEPEDREMASVGDAQGVGGTVEDGENVADR